MKLKIIALVFCIFSALTFTTVPALQKHDALQYNMPTEQEWDIGELHGKTVEVIIHTSGESLTDYYFNSDNRAIFSEYLSSKEGKTRLNAVRSGYDRVKKALRSNRISFEETGEMGVLVCGFSAMVKYDDIPIIETLPEVAFVEMCETYSIPEICLSETDELLPEALSDEVSALSYGSGRVYDADSVEGTNGGEGMLIGVIDTGIDPSHDAFSVMPENGKYSFTNRYDTYSLNAVGNTYINDKIVFAYDYAGNDTDTRNGKNGDHGYHVSGIAAGNNGSTFKGVAYNAQIAMFKIYGDTVLQSNGSYNYSSGASGISQIYALEDAVAIGCDVINMSLGTANGFSINSTTDSLYGAVQRLGITLCVSAGNNGSTTFSRSYRKHDPSYDGYTEAFTSYQNVNLVGFPSTHSAALSVANAALTMSYNPNRITAASISNSSSWGCAEDLSLKPEITAAGTNVYSAAIENKSDKPYYGESNYYETKSGTSMAAPNATGIAAVVRAFYADKRSEFATDTEFKNFIDSVLMSTSVPISEWQNGELSYYLSPRAQGAGLVSTQNAINSGAYVTVPGKDKPKLEFGDDPIKSGVYEGEITINNICTESRTYSLGGIAMTNRVTGEGSAPGTYVYDKKSGSYRIIAEPYILQALPEYTLGGSNVNTVTVAAGQSVTLGVSIVLTEDDKNYIDKYFPYGSFAEGYLLLDGGVNTDLTVPYIGFYGDWYSSGVFDSTVYENELPIYDNGAVYAVVTGENGKSVNKKLGVYPYEYDASALTAEQLSALNSAEFIKDRVALNYGEDGCLSVLSNIDLYLLKNAKQIKIELADPESGYIYSSFATGETQKSHAANEVISKQIKSFALNFTPKSKADAINGRAINNTVVSLNLYARGEYARDGETWNDILSVPIYIDSQKPSLVEYSLKDGNLSFELWDNHYLAAYDLRVIKGGKYVSLNDYYTPIFAEKGDYSYHTENLENYLTEIENSDDGNLYLFVSDYAGNYSIFNVGGDGERYLTVSGEYVENTGSEQGDADIILNGNTLEGYSGGGSIGYVQEGVTRIGYNAFNSSALTDLTLPSSLARIGVGAFVKAKNLNTVYSLALNAPLLESVLPSGEYTPYANFSEEGKMRLIIAREAKGYCGYEWEKHFDIRTADYQININANGGTAYPVYLGLNGVQPNIQEPTRIGYIFDGWFTDENLTVPFEFSASDCSIYAKWQAISYPVTVKYPNGEVTEEYEYDSLFTLPEPVEIRGYSFAGYSASAQTYYGGDTIPVTGEISVIANYVPKTYSLTVKWLSGETYESKSFNYVYSSGLSNLSLSRDGYNLMGLFFDENLSHACTDDNFPTENSEVVLFASWETADYKVNFTTSVSGISLPGNTTAKYLSQYTLGKPPAKEGYMFKGYVFNGDTYFEGDSVTVTGDIVFTLTYERGTYYVVYQTGVDGYTIEPSSFNYNSRVTLKTAEYGLFEFVGWFADEALTEAYAESRMPGHDVTVYAKWIKYFTVSVTVGDVTANTVLKENELFTAENPTPNEGERFDGWYLDKDFNLKTSGEFTVDKDVALFAKFVPVKQEESSSDNNHPGSAEGKCSSCGAAKNAADILLAALIITAVIKRKK